MSVSEFMEIVDSVADNIRSVSSARREEREAESVRLQRSIATLRECKWPARLSDEKRAKALRMLDLGNAKLCEVVR